MQQNPQRLTRILHWLSALILIGLLASGIYMADGHSYAFYDWHKAFGVIALCLILFRFLHRAKHPWPSSTIGTKYEKSVKRVHNLLLIGGILLPITGLLYSGLGGFGVSLFGLTLIPNGYNASGEVIAFHKFGSDLGKLLHFYLGYLFTALVILHIAAALKHHFINRDQTLNNMLKSQIKHNPK